MAFTNKETKEINCKIILFGAESSNRREILNSLKRSVNKESQKDSFEKLKNNFSPFRIYSNIHW